MKIENIDPLLSKYREKMEAHELPEVVIESFKYYFTLLVEGETGNLSEEEISAVSELPDAEQLPHESAVQGQRALPSTVLIKLNGGLGTGMGLSCAKSLLEVKGQLTFLDIIAKQALQTSVPLILMNSFATRSDSLELLNKKYPDLKKEIPLDFTQHKIPKVRRSDLSPAEYPQNPDLEWCPPGHGDLYTAMVTSGLLDQLIESGYRTAFVSNSDNLGAFLDPGILGFFVAHNYGFMMEVADRTPADKKGGHLAKLTGEKRFVLRESAQCPQEDLKHFQNIDKHRFFNTNNLWINLISLRKLLSENDGFLRLPLIRNEKQVNPADPDSYGVYQLETAMGAAISVFPDSQALRVPRKRFAPVKTTEDLLVISSDATVLSDDFRIEPAPKREGRLPQVSLDSNHYKLTADLKKRFPSGPPSLIDCDHFQVEGRFRFGSEVVVKGRTRLVNHSDKTVTVEDGTILKGEIVY